MIYLGLRFFLRMVRRNLISTASTSETSVYRAVPAFLDRQVGLMAVRMPPVSQVFGGIRGVELEITLKGAVREAAPVQVGPFR